MKFIDLHCDTVSAIYEIRRAGGQAELRKNCGHLDLMRLKEGKCLGQNFALFTDLKKEKDPYAYVGELLKIWKEESSLNQDLIRPARTVDELLENEKAGLVSAVLTIEEGAACRGEPGLLREFYREGVRMMTLTWNYPNELAWPNRRNPVTGSMTPETEHGLTEKGKEFVELMEELGMAVDVSHLGDAGFFQLADMAKKPFLASHSNARTEASHVRNLTDEMIRLLANRGGIIGINYCGAFLNDSEISCQTGGKSRISDMVRHILHIRNVGGTECLALGSDFDGIGGELEVDSPAALVRLEEALYQAGLTTGEVERLFWKNALRFYRDVWK